MQTIIHIGAGHCSELETYLATDAQRIVLIEPIPALAARLAQQVKGHNHIVVVEAAVTPDPANNQLHEYNLQEASSLRLPTGLKTLFPGLRTVKTHTVTTFTPQQLLQEYAPEQGKPATLVIQAPGEEQAILQALIDSDQLKGFSDLKVTANPEPLYEGSVAADSLLKALTDYGYDIASENRQDPDWPSWELRRNPMKNELLELKIQIRQLQATNKDLAGTLESQKTQATKDLEAVQKLHEEKDKALRAAEKQLADQVARIQSQQHVQTELKQEVEQLKKQSSEFKQQLDQAVQIGEERKAELEKVQSELADHKGWLTSRKKQVQELEQTLVQVREELAIKADTLAAKEQAEQEAWQQLEQLTARQADQQTRLEQQQNELKAMESKLAQAIHIADERKAELEKVQSELADHKGWLASRKKQVQELEQALEQARAAQQEMEKENASLKTRVQSLEQEKRYLQESQASGQQILTRLEEKMEQLFNQQSSQLQQATNALGQHITRQFQNQRQQIQAITGLNQYLESGEQPLEYGGWAIGADLAGHLVRAIENNQYDLIIEFGSGTSTVLLARAVLNTISSGSRQLGGNPALEHAESRGAAGSRQLQALEGFDLPHRILSFEQDKTYLQQTLNTLTQANLKPLVDLVLAPLVPTSRTTQQGNQVLFYDCEQNLARIAQLYTGRTAKILVLVDGPHSPQGNPLAREPALATLLQYLSAHQLHVVLDDANREGEQQVVRHWQELCEQRGLVFKQTQLDTEKGALWVTVND